MIITDFDSLMGDIPEPLGGDIWHYSGGTPQKHSILHGRTRFLDALWLPVPLGQLDPDQVILINRFREHAIDQDAQFNKARASRTVILGTLRRQNVTSVLEVGCGKFPLAQEISLSCYQAVEIDEEAILECQSEGLDVNTVEKLTQCRRDNQFDVCVALYAMHFKFSEALLEYIARSLKPGGVFIFNVIAINLEKFIETNQSLFNAFPVFRVFKTASLSKREFFFLAASGSGVNTLDFAANLDAELVSVGSVTAGD